MKTNTNILVLFFAFFISISAQTTNNYGLLELKKVVGATLSVDGRWIKYAGNLYCDIESLRKDFIPPVLFEKSSYIVGAKATLDNEFLYYGRSNYQKFRIDWEPISRIHVQKSASPQTLLSLTILIIIFIGYFARSTIQRRSW